MFNAAFLPFTMYDNRLTFAVGLFYAIKSGVTQGCVLKYVIVAVNATFWALV